MAEGSVFSKIFGGFRKAAMQNRIQDPGRACMGGRRAGTAKKGPKGNGPNSLKGHTKEEKSKKTAFFCRRTPVSKTGKGEAEVKEVSNHKKVGYGKAGQLTRRLLWIGAARHHYGQSP